MNKIFAAVAGLLVLSFAASGACAADYYDTHLLTQKDVQLYLRIMHKAADQADAIRAKQKPCPKPVDLPKGRPPTQAEITALTTAATCSANSMMVSTTDDAIAQQEGAEPHYGEVKDAIESLIQPNRHSRDGAGPVESVALCGSAPGAWECAPPDMTPQQKAYWEDKDKFPRDNNKFLQPYRDEIQRLETRVRRIGEEQPNPLAPPTGRQPQQYTPPPKHH
ncbi:MAG TPA: hypothetical protein VHZ78_06475 [Rhizomicrobium sp.]|jgi:hypothetical protein|nr:hypothetical protein [Rhizomicrobium sp.]